MKKSNILLPLIAFLVLALASSCKKEDTNSPIPTETKTKFELLTENNWVLTAYTLDGEDKFKDIPNCEKDNINKYLPNNDYLYDIGIDKCGNESQVRAISSWEFDNDETTLKRADGYNVKIIEINNNTLITEEKRLNGVIALYTYKAVPTYRNILAAGKWKLTELSENGNSIYSTLDDCVKDNLISFKASGEYTIESGATKCKTTDPDILLTEKWVLFGFEREINVSNMSSFNILEITQNRLILESRNTIYSYMLQ